MALSLLMTGRKLNEHFTTCEKYMEFKFQYPQAKLPWSPGPAIVGLTVLRGGPETPGPNAPAGSLGTLAGPGGPVSAAPSCDPHRRSGHLVQGQSVGNRGEGYVTSPGVTRPHRSLQRLQVGAPGASSTPHTAV